MGKNLVKGGFSRCWGGKMLTSKFSGSGEPPLPYPLTPNPHTTPSVGKTMDFVFWVLQLLAR